MEAWHAARVLGPPPWIVKDHVKSAKERWAEACFVPAGATREDFERICARLLEERGDRFERGFVVRRFLPFKVWGRTPSGPAHLEFRLFFGERPAAGGGVLRMTSTWTFRTSPPSSRSAGASRRASSPWTSRCSRGRWAVVEVNDGGVSGLPASIDPRELFAALLGVDR